jgi:hypothetical protein
MVALLTDGNVEPTVECGLVLREAVKVDDRDMDVDKT